MAAALLAYFVLFFGIAIFWPTWRLWRRDRVNALVIPYDDTAQGLVGRWFRGTLVSLFAVLAALTLGLSEGAFGRLAWLDCKWLKLAGWVLLAVSLVWVVMAQAQMGKSWRIGIDPKTKPPLVRTGLFATSRNPIFLGMRISLLAVFMILPNGATLSILLLGEALIQTQVRLEEVHLGGLFGEEYRAYTTAVPRWL